MVVIILHQASRIIQTSQAHKTSCCQLLISHKIDIINLQFNQRNQQGGKASLQKDAVRKSKQSSKLWLSVMHLPMAVIKWFLFFFASHTYVSVNTQKPNM